MRWLLLGCTALSVANCAGTQATRRDASELKYGVRSSPRVIPEGQPIPKGGGRDMTGRPYVVAGRTYVPHPGRGYDREGWASWYGSAFHGRLTANGEVFDRQSIAAAHPTLPLPCYVRVTIVVNHRSMVVRVNDRGPYEQGRLIDLSERAADALGFHRRGTSRVRVEYVGRASLSGSDDAKLLATLRTDGVPASLDPGRQQPSMLARLDVGSALRPQAPAALVAARPDRNALPEYAEPSPRRTPVPAPAIRSASAEPPPARPLDIRPPRRAELDDGIYFAEPGRSSGTERVFAPARRDRAVSLRSDGER